MKKLAVLIVAIVSGFSFILAGCSCKKDDTVIRVNEVTHSVFYAPLYVAINKGYFADEGLKLEITNGGGADKSMTALITNAADIGLMGPEAAIYNVLEGNPNAPKIFGQLTKRDGSFLVGRTAMPDFKWSDLIGKEIIAGREGGVPAMTLEYALNKNGIYDGVNVTLRYDISFNNMGPAFVEGTGDFTTLFEPAASEVVLAGNGHIIASVGQEAGQVPFTAFMATNAYMQKNPERVKAFLRAIYKGYLFLTSAPLDDVVDALAPSFDTSKPVLKETIRRYVEIDAWTATPVMNEADYNRLITIMTNAGHLDGTVPFTSVVDNTIAEDVMRELI